MDVAAAHTRPPTSVIINSTIESASSVASQNIRMSRPDRNSSCLVWLKRSFARFWTEPIDRNIVLNMNPSGASVGSSDDALLPMQRHPEPKCVCTHNSAAILKLYLRHSPRSFSYG